MSECTCTYVCVYSVYSVCVYLYVATNSQPSGGTFTCHCEKPLKDLEIAQDDRISLVYSFQKSFVITTN